MRDFDGFCHFTVEHLFAVFRLAVLLVLRFCSGVFIGEFSICGFSATGCARLNLRLQVQMRTMASSVEGMYETVVV